MKDLKDWAAVQNVYKKTKSIRATARILGISRNTVKKLLKLNAPPEYQRKIYYSKVDAFKETIIEWRCEPYCYNGTRIFRELKKRGYTGSIGPIYTFLHKIDEDTVGISKKATVRHESPPGDQAQFDWSEYEVVVAGRYQKVYCFAMILSASRKKAVCFSRKADANAIYEAIQELFEDLGGVTLELLIDNPKALVVENNPKTESEIKYNPHAMMLARHLGTELNACPCYWPRKKGKIERPFNYIEEQFIKGNSFSSMEDLNRRGKDFISEWNNEKHTTTKRIPSEYFIQEELALLLPLPMKRYIVEPMLKRIISPDSFISINSNKYSVPVRYVGKTLYYRIVYGFRIEIYDKEHELILTTEETDKKHMSYVNSDHYEPIAKPVSTSIPQIRRDFTARFSNGERYLLEAGKMFDQPTHYARKIMELQDLYDDETLNRFIGIALDNGCLDIKSFKALLRDYNTGNRVITGNATRNAIEPLEARNCDYYEIYAKEVLNGR